MGTQKQDGTTGQTQSFDDTPDVESGDANTLPEGKQEGYTAPGGTERDRSLDGDSPYPQGFGRPAAPTEDDRAAQRERRSAAQEQQADQQSDADTAPHDTEQR